jgi:predicted flap endonuclease-1-like 5' DNA nuclease
MSSASQSPQTQKTVTDRAHQLASELMQARQELSQKQVELRRVTSERNALRTRLGRELSRVRELESALRSEADLRQQAAELHNSANAALRARVAELEARPERGPSQATPKTESGLRGIKGIGPAYQRSLREHGVDSIEQIAAWTEAEITSIAAKIKVKAERIQRENWVGQAQERLKARGA